MWNIFCNENQIQRFVILKPALFYVEKPSGKWKISLGK